MRLTIILIITLLVVSPFNYSNAGNGVNAGDVIVTLPDSDTSEYTIGTLIYFFDLRERETFIQFTYPDVSFPLLDDDDDIFGQNAVAHIQIFDVNNNCNENDFFDNYTPRDTHTYNMRDIQTNDGNPSGVVLPQDAYGIVVISALRTDGIEFTDIADPIGNFRILDNNGYEYRTNALFIADAESGTIDPEDLLLIASSFNFNTEGGVTLSDVVGITLVIVEDPTFEFEWTALPVQGIYSPFDIDIYDLNEVPFSCRDIIFSCVNDENPLVEELLEVAANANVASFEYGINNAIPHSKGGELLCPGNIISDGTVYLLPEPYTQTAVDILENLDGEGPFFIGYIGLNNGNGRGSMDSFWIYNFTPEVQ